MNKNIVLKTLIVILILSGTFLLYTINKKNISIPSCLTNEIPIYPQAIILDAFETDNTCTAFVETSDSAQEINLFYKKALSNANWEMKVERSNKTPIFGQEETFQTWIKGDNGLLIETTPEKELHKITLFLSKEASHEK